MEERSRHDGGVAPISLTARHYRRLAWHCRFEGVGGTPDQCDGLDNDLLVAGLLAWRPPESYERVGRICPTPSGRLALAARTTAVRHGRRPHEDLIGDFIDRVIPGGEIAWRGLELQLEPVRGKAPPYPLRNDGRPMIAARPDIYWVSARLDPRAWAPTVIEMKSNREDFRRDAGSGKHRVYEPIAERCYFAAPAGVIEPSEVPPGWGLYLREDGAWRFAKRARRNRSWQLSPRQMMKLIVHRAGGEPARLEAEMRGLA